MLITGRFMDHVTKRHDQGAVYIQISRQL